MNGAKIKVSIVDDHPLVIEGLQMLLDKRNDMEIIGHYVTGNDLINSLKKIHPDVLILDIKLPDIPGDELITKVLQRQPGINILVLTYLDNFYYIKTMMKQGALGYILKTSENQVLLNAIHAVARGQEYLEDQVKNTLIHHVVASKKDSDADVMLSKREKEALQYIASNYTSQQIADKLFISKRTVERHRANLLRKLHVKNAPALVKKAMQLNLLDH